MLGRCPWNRVHDQKSSRIWRIEENVQSRQVKSEEIQTAIFGAPKEAPRHVWRPSGELWTSISSRASGNNDGGTCEKLQRYDFQQGSHIFSFFYDRSIFITFSYENNFCLGQFRKGIIFVHAFQKKFHVLSFKSRYFYGHLCSAFFKSIRSAILNRKKNQNLRFFTIFKAYVRMKINGNPDFQPIKHETNSETPNSTGEHLGNKWCPGKSRKDRQSWRGTINVNKRIINKKLSNQIWNNLLPPWCRSHMDLDKLFQRGIRSRSLKIINLRLSQMCFLFLNKN